MLDAFLKKNVRKILLTRTSTHASAKNEDAITSMVFTPLRFMEPRNVLSCLAAFLPELENAVSLLSPESCSLELWPQGLKAAAYEEQIETRCEPDLLVRFKLPGGDSLTILGEMKWDWLPRKEEICSQIERERSAISKPSVSNVQRPPFVFAVLKYQPPYEAREIGCDELLTWRDVHRRLTKVRTAPFANHIVREWAASICKFLTLAEQLIFTGFEGVCSLPREISRSFFFFQADVSDRPKGMKLGSFFGFNVSKVPLQTTPARVIFFSGRRT
ncbi:MAG: hypothetical protein AB7K64_01145 [Variibacter sp.]